MVVAKTTVIVMVIEMVMAMVMAMATVIVAVTVMAMVYCIYMTSICSLWSEGGAFTLGAEGVVSGAAVVCTDIKSVKRS